MLCCTWPLALAVTRCDPALASRTLHLSLLLSTPPPPPLPRLSTNHLSTAALPPSFPTGHHGRGQECRAGSVGGPRQGALTPARPMHARTHSRLQYNDASVGAEPEACPPPGGPSERSCRLTSNHHHNHTPTASLVISTAADQDLQQQGPQRRVGRRDRQAPDERGGHRHRRILPGAPVRAHGPQVSAPPTRRV